MKRLIALITVIAIVFSFTAVYAEKTVEEKFMEVMSNPITEGNVKATVRLEADGGLFDLLGTVDSGAAVIKSLLNSSIDYDINAVSNDELTKMSAEGRITFNSGAQETIPSLGLDLWMNMDVSNTESIQFFVIVKAAEPNMAALMGDQYILVDFAKIPEFKEMIRALVEMGFFDREYIESVAEEIIDEAKLMQLYERLMNGVDLNLTYADGKYSLVMGDAEIKAVFGTLFNNLIDLVAELAGEEIGAAELQAAKAELAAGFAAIANVQIFDPTRGIVAEATVDGENKIASEHMEVNLDLNVMDIIQAISPEEVGETGMPAEMFDLSLSVIGDAVVNDLPADYSVNFPKLDNSNSTDVVAEAYGDAASYGYISGTGDDNIKIVYNGTVVELENKPVMLNDRTFVPFRRLANMLGISDEYIGYDDATQKVYINYDGINIEMYLGSTVAYVNGEMKVLDVPAFTLEDRTYIPVRFVSEMFGKDVGYEENNGLQMITIND